MATSDQIPYYEDSVDLKALALGHGELSKMADKKRWLDFQDPRLIKYITIALLKRDFSLDIKLPDDRLCARVPIRYNYVRWIQELIDTTSPTYADSYEPNRCVTGLDIGTGASAIYTILALKTRPSWRMCATDIDETSLTYARYNLQTNELDSRAQVLQTKTSDSLIPLFALGVEKLDFTICNPPFYSSEEEMQQSLGGKGKKSTPHSICTGTPTEMVYPGGDIGFVSRIFAESLKLREGVQWYSSMFGKLTSANLMVETLRNNNISNYAVCYLFAGGLTRRWAVAWSFADLRPRHDVSRHWSTNRMLDPFPTSFHIPISISTTVVTSAIDAHLSSLQLRWSFDPTIRTGIGIASQNVWNRAFRYQQKGKAEQNGKKAQREEGEGGLAEKIALAFKITVLEEVKEVNVRWLRGADQVIWESFTGMLHRFVGGVKEG